MPSNIDHSTPDGASGYTAWYSYARLLSRYRHVYWAFNLLACLILGALYWGGEEGTHRFLMICVLALIVLCSTFNLVMDSSFSLQKYGSEADARKLINYNFYISSLISVLWGVLTLIIIIHTKKIEPPLLACLVILMALNIPRAAISRALYYVQSMLITLPAIFFLVLTGEMALGGLLLLMALSIGVGINAIILLLYDYQNHEQEMVTRIKEGPHNVLLSGAELDTLLKIEWQRATREHQYLSMICIELENDELSRITLVTGAIRSVARRSADCVAYLDDGVFRILLPNTTPEHALSIAERIQMKVQRLQLETQTASIYSLQDQENAVYFGVAGCRPGRMDIKDDDNEGAGNVTQFPAALMSALQASVQLARDNGQNTLHLQQP